MSQYPFMSANSLPLDTGYIVVSNKVRVHYIQYYERKPPKNTPYTMNLFTCNTYDPRTGETLFSIKAARLKELYEIPAHIPDKQLIRFIEAKIELKEAVYAKS